jgi:ribonuclease D
MTPAAGPRVADYEFIESKEALASLAQELLTEKVLAFDTEADSFYHYFDKTCLVQVATRKNIYLIDPLAIGGPKELSPLAPIFASEKIRKVFHAAEYDLFVLKRDCAFEFQNLFDTMISSQFLGYPSVGLAGIAERHFGVVLPKEQQRSDWSTRPLSQKQLTYAASDVLYLISLAETLEKELREVNRLRWAREEFTTLCERQWPDREFDELGYLKIKGARRLSPKSLSILRELYLVRDARAREIDRPAFKVLGNRTLLDIAERLPSKRDDLSEIKGVTDLIQRRLGRELMAAVRAGRKTEHGPIPKLRGTNRKRLDRQGERRLATLKEWRGAKAVELKIDPGVLCPNAALEVIATRNPKSLSEFREITELKSWFTRAFGAEVLKIAPPTTPPQTATQSGSGTSS